MKQATKETKIGERLMSDMDAADPMLMDIGMHRLGCYASQAETI